MKKGIGGYEMLITLCRQCGGRIASKGLIKYCPECGCRVRPDAEVKQAEFVVGPDEKLPPAVRWEPGKMLTCRYCGNRVPMPEMPSGVRESGKVLWIQGCTCPRCGRKNEYGPPDQQKVEVDVVEADDMAGSAGRSILDMLTDVEDKLKWN